MNKRITHPFARILLDYKQFWQGIAFLSIFALLERVLKSRSAILWGEAVYFGVRSEGIPCPTSEKLKKLSVTQV